MDVDTREDWRAQALCAQVDPELFFPIKGEHPRDALRVCARCPVREPCDAFADTLGYAHGVWGGATENRRRRSA